MAEAAGNAFFWNNRYFHSIIVIRIFSFNKGEVMSTEPWEEQVFPEEPKEPTRKNRNYSGIRTPILTILLSIFFVIFVGILLFILYTSNGNTSRDEATTGFYGASTSQAKSANGDKSNDQASKTSSANHSETTAANSETTVSQTEAHTRNGHTLTVLAGEGAGNIAARGGITIEKLYALNPEKMVGPGGTWWANPGDVVYID